MAAKMKSDTTVRRRLTELRRECIDGADDPVLRRIAYAMEVAILWARDPQCPWEAPANEARLLAKLLREDLAGRA